MVKNDDIDDMAGERPSPKMIFMLIPTANCIQGWARTRTVMDDDIHVPDRRFGQAQDIRVDD